MSSPTSVAPSPGADYVVHLDNFEGPLELLLYLIERQELDITAVSIARVTDQYLEYLAQAEDVSPAKMADFVAMAARLLVIKSRALLPQPPAPEEAEEEDPGDLLARQLREYKRFRDVAQWLRERERAHLRSFVRVAPLPKVERPLALGAAAVTDLARAYLEVLARQNPVPPDTTVVTPYPITIEDKLTELRTLLQQQGRLEFRHILQRSRHRQEIIVSFLAVLEMVRLGEVHVVQEGLFQPIVILWTTANEDATGPTSPTNNAVSSSPTRPQGRP